MDLYSQYRCQVLPTTADDFFKTLLVSQKCHYSVRLKLSALEQQSFQIEHNQICPQRDKGLAMTSGYCLAETQSDSTRATTGCSRDLFEKDELDGCGKLPYKVVVGGSRRE